MCVHQHGQTSDSDTGNVSRGIDLIEDGSCGGVRELECGREDGHQAVMKNVMGMKEETGEEHVKVQGRRGKQTT